MALRSGYTLERMREIGRLSADQARNNLERAVFARLKALTCEYCGVGSAQGSVESGAAVRANSNVAYRWTVTVDGFEEQHVAHVRADKAACNGVAFPKGWKTALQSLDLPDIVRRHLECTKAESRVPGLGCRLLGAPARVNVPEEGQGVGAVLSLNGVATALCAHVAADQWLCHRGSSSDDGAPDWDNPWQATDLVACDLADVDEGKPRKQIGCCGAHVLIIFINILLYFCFKFLTFTVFLIQFP